MISMTMTGRRFLLISCMIASIFGFLSSPFRAQSFPMNLEGYSIADQVPSFPARSTVALVAPYRAVGMGTLLKIVNETDPLHPVVVSQVALSSPALGMLYRNGRLFIAAGPSGLLIMDVSNPLNPQFSSSRKVGSPVALAMNDGGKILYVCDGSENIQALNVEKSTVPKLAYVINYGYARFWDAVVVGKYLVTAAGPKGLLVYSLEHPGRPVLRKHFTSLRAARTVSPDPSLPTLFAVADEYDGVAFVNFPTWSTPIIKGTLATAVTPVSAQYLPDTERVLVGLGAGGYAIVDAADPAAPVLLSQPATPSPVMQVSTDGGHAYILCNDGGMYYVNVSNPVSPVATLALAGTPAFGALAVKGNIAFISRGSAIEVWDCTDPYNLSFVTSVPTPMFATDLLVSGTLLFAGCQQEGVAIFDISYPLAPTPLSVLPVDGSAGQMDLAGSLLAVATGTGGALLADVSVPTAPTPYPNPWLGSKDKVVAGVAFSSSTMLCAGSDASGLSCLDVTTPSSPKLLGSLPVGVLPGRDYAYSHYVYSLVGSAVEIADITDPTKPKLAGSIKTTSADAAAFGTSTFFLSDGVTGFSEYDLADPTTPLLTSLFGSPTYAYQGVPLANGARLVSAREGGLWTLLSTNCNGPLLHLPCEGATLSPITNPMFSWEPVTGSKYHVDICQSSSFPSDKTISSSSDKLAYYQPSNSSWQKIVTKARKHGNTVYWRVIYEGKKNNTRSEVRTLTIP
jgi:hypothetical protein